MTKQVNQEQNISFGLNIQRNKHLFEKQQRAIHLQEVIGVSKCGFWQDAITTKDHSKVTCEHCLNIIEQEKCTHDHLMCPGNIKTVKCAHCCKKLYRRGK